MSIDLCCINRNTKQTGYDEDADTLHSEMGCVGVPQGMSCAVFIDTGFLHGSYDVFSQTIPAKSDLLKTLKYVYAFVRQAFKYLNGFCRQRDRAFTSRFCASSLTILYAQKSLRNIYVLPFEVCQFVAAKTCRYKDANHRFNTILSSLDKAVKLLDGKKDNLMPFTWYKPHYLNGILIEITPPDRQVEYAFKVDNGMVYCGCPGPTFKPPRLIFFDQGWFDILQLNIRRMARLLEESIEHSGAFPVALDRERSEVDFDVPEVFFKEAGESPTITASIFSLRYPEFDVFFDVMSKFFIAGFERFANAFTGHRIGELDPIKPISPVNTSHDYHIFATLLAIYKEKNGEYRELIIWIITTPFDRVNTSSRQARQVEIRNIAEYHGTKRNESTTFLPRLRWDKEEKDADERRV